MTDDYEIFAGQFFRAVERGDWCHVISLVDDTIVATYDNGIAAMLEAARLEKEALHDAGQIDLFGGDA